jgi:hypothetical protein
MPKTQRRINRNLRIAQVCLFLALAFALAWQFLEFRSYRQGIYDRCVQRVHYDEAANDGRAGLVWYFRQQIAVEQGNRFIDEPLRRKRITAARETITALEAANAAAVSPNCAKVK